MGNDSFFSKWCWENWIATCKIMKRPFFSPYLKNSKWIKDLNVRPKTIKLLEENISCTHFEISLSNIFFRSVSSKSTKAKINK